MESLDTAALSAVRRVRIPNLKEDVYAVTQEDHCSDSTRARDTGCSAEDGRGSKKGDADADVDAAG